MTEINRAAGSTNLSDIAAQQRLGRAGTRPDAAASRGLERASDSVELGTPAVARAKLSELPEVRSELVNQIALKINDPDYDIDANLELAFDKMFG